MDSTQPGHRTALTWAKDGGLPAALSGGLGFPKSGLAETQPLCAPLAWAMPPHPGETWRGAGTHGHKVLMWALGRGS